MRYASRLREGGENEAATAEYLWLWKHMLEKDPNLFGVRHSFLVSALEGLFAEHPPARATFSEIRDAAAPSRDAIDSHQLADWISLNTALGEQNVTLAWYDANAERILADRELRRAVGQEIIPTLVAAERFADVGRMYDDPLSELRKVATEREEMLRQIAADPGLSPEMVEQLKQFSGMHLRQAATDLVRALRAAGRTDDAKAVTDEARGLGVELA
jgi:hypothetical protein